MDSTPLLSVCMISYAHEDYIIQSLKSVLNQKTNFDYEVILANDCSPDNTDSIVVEYLKENNNAENVKYFCHSENIGMYKNLLFALSQCKGKYIAICEGDDFWIDTLKLQKQVNFLESNPKFEVCFSNINIINDEGVIVKEKLIPEDRKEVYLQKDLPIWAPTLTRVFRNRDFKDLPKAPGMDNVMLLYQSKFGKIKFINQITGTYRFHDDGIYSALTLAKKREHIILTDLVSLELIDEILFPKYFGMLFKKLVELYTLDMNLFNKNKKLVKKSYKIYRNKLTVNNRLKIGFSFCFFAMPFIMNFKISRKIFLKVLNKVFIYH